jgi:MFS family permease
MMGIGIVLMVRALYGSYELAGVLSATEALSWAIGSAILSNRVDRFGQRKVMVPAAFAFAISLGTMIVLAAVNVWPGWLFIPCVFAGLTAGSPGALVRARWNYALNDPHLFHTALALESALDECTWVIGPVLAAFLATIIAPEASLAVVVIVASVGALIFYSLRDSEPPVSPPQNKATRARQEFLLTIPGVGQIVVVSALIGIVFGSCDVTVVAANDAWNAQALAGVVLGAIAAGSAIAGFTYGGHRWKTPMVKRFIIGVPCMFIGSSSLVFAWSPLSLAVAGFVSGFAIAPTLINTNGLIQRIVPESRLTEGLSWIGTALGVGVSVGSSLAGWLIDHISFSAGFLATSVAAGCAAAFALGSYRKISSVVRSRVRADVGPSAEETRDCHEVGQKGTVPTDVGPSAEKTASQ